MLHSCLSGRQLWSCGLRPLYVRFTKCVSGPSQNMSIGFGDLRLSAMETMLSCFVLPGSLWGPWFARCLFVYFFGHHLFENYLKPHLSTYRRGIGDGAALVADSGITPVEFWKAGRGPEVVVGCGAEPQPHTPPEQWSFYFWCRFGRLWTRQRPSGCPASIARGWLSTTQFKPDAT